MKSNLSLLLILLCLPLLAQLNSKTKWGQISQEEINYSQVPFEPEAGAVILYEEGKTKIYGMFQTHVYRRIKILNERGIEAANQVVTYYSHKGIEKIGSLKAQTLNMENGEFKIEKVEKNAIFDVQINPYYNQLKFTFPNVKVGSILEFEFDFYDENLYFVEAWQFQHEYPTLFSTYKVDNQMGLDYTSLSIGDKIVTTHKGKKDNSNWTLTNIPSFNSLEFLYNPEDMAERIVFQLRGYNKSGGSFGSTSYEDVLESWSQLSTDRAKEYKNLQSNSIGKEIAETIPNGSNQKETLQNIYNYFKSTYSWNRFHGIYPKQSNREVYKNKNGNSADLNLLLNSIVKAKGMQAEMILVSTRDNGKLITSYPFLGQFNYAVNLVTTSDGSTFLIDAANMKDDLGYAPLPIYNHYGLMVVPNKEKFVMLHPQISEYQSVQYYKFKDNTFLLTQTDKRNGYFKWDESEVMEGESEFTIINSALDVLMTETKREKKDSDKDNFELIRTQSQSNPLQNPAFIGIENPLNKVVSFFKLTNPTRERNLEFDFPFLYKADAVIEIPDGYKVEIPTGYKTHEEAGEKNIIFYQTAEIKENKLILHVEFLLGKSIFTENYSEIKSFFDKINGAVQKNILLKKG